MIQIVGETRQFRVHARHVEVHHSRLLEEVSFEAAAVAYVEDLHALGDETEINVIAREVGTGREHCFRIDLDTGEAAPCG
jgi:hypothetical protein